MKSRTLFMVLIAIGLTLACGISSEPTADVDATIAAAVAQTAAAQQPTDTAPPPPTATPKTEKPTDTPDVEATVAAAVEQTAAAQSPTATAVPSQPTAAPADTAPDITFSIYDDPAGYFSVPVPDSWEQQTDDATLALYNADETAAVVIVAVPDDTSTTTDDLTANGETFLNAFFEDWADVTITDTATDADNALIAQKFTATGDTDYQGGLIVYLRGGVGYYELHFAESDMFNADAKMTDPEVKLVWDTILEGLTFTPPEAAASTATPTAAPTQSGGVYKLAFARWDGGKHDLYIANTNGSGEKFLLERAAGPSWSPDGTTLAFYGEEGVDRQIRDGVEYTVSGITDGILWMTVSNFPSDITQVEIGQFTREGSGRYADWSPNGDMIAFDATHGSPDRRIYFLGTDDNQQYNVEILGEQSSWSPDNRKIVYRSGRDNKQGIWISNRDDSGAHPITNEGSDSFPAWSPDGRKIAFHRDSGGNVDIYVMNTDGSGVTRLTSAAGPDTLPAWTPDGRIVFRSARSGSWGIYIMNADGSGQRQIIANADPGPDWTFGKMDVR